MKFSRPNKPIKNTYLVNLSLMNRFWIFQIVIILIILACIFIIANFSGVISDLSENPYYTVSGDLKNMEADLSKKCLSISNNTVELAKKINKSIHKQLAARGIEPSGLYNHPELLEEILGTEVEKAGFAMEKAGATGVFLFLNATVNPALERAKDSKAGFFIVNMDNSPVPYESQQLFLLYGPVQLARDNNINLHTQWELELNCYPDTPKRRRDIFKKPFEAAMTNRNNDIYSLGYWNPLFQPADNTDRVISFSVPLLDSEGNPYGVCGLEMSKIAFESILYKQSPHAFEREVLLFSTQIGSSIPLENALIYGMNSSWLLNENSMYLYVSPAEKSEKLNDYYFTKPSRNNILGCDIKVRMYPGSSVFKNENWSLALLLPAGDVTAKTARLFKVIVLFILLLVGSIVITFFTSKYCISPLLEAIKKIKYNETPVKTHITEIDDLIEFLRMRIEPSFEEEPADRLELSSVSGNYQRRFTDGSPQSSSITAVKTEKRTAETGAEQDQVTLTPEQYTLFENRLLTLSNAERRIFNLYIEGHDAKEICSILFISINTLKTHNRRIYTKMNVSSRTELLKYCNELMRKL